MTTVEVFADVTCPFAHVGLRRFVSERDARGRSDVLLRVRAWPLEKVNGHAEKGDDVARRVRALRGSVAPDLFRGFDADRFPTTSLPALAEEAAGYAARPLTGEGFSLLVRTALFEDGQDIADRRVLANLAPVGAAGHGGEYQVLSDWEDGRSRQVIGSPHFFVGGADFFCPSMKIGRDGERLDIEFDDAGFASFLDRCFG